MAVNLSKGQKVDLTKSNPGLAKIIVGLGWDTNKYDGGKEFDLDASAFCLNETGKVNSDADFMFYNNPANGNNSIVLSGDNRTGEGAGDDETIKIDLANVPADISKIAFCITIHEAQERNQNFGQVANSYVRVVNEATGEELIRYDLGEDYSVETAVVVGELYRHGGEWKFSAVGSGFKDGLAGLCRDFGINV
ncbi:MAG: TerD family protein [Paenibacillus macerans]|uniref:Chemical-damaging agent resistance protein C n=1 Tax=Paenibacillus macerans TaxID=44252 RepID=A0A6N8EV40_PAEMA|nr:TerD family protein [Paenibacillus macerans]MDU7477892.1 TerD family protein [Paenibacillus macerans]MEC0329649.1 TerD family protein [Paenibacillus macerans]MED4957365.1 TerD family protein [Paenibacillus macerans]MUG22301.1 chemical-damaging agent resistance protein C [Paenibacillus macerans]GBK65858.1 chemical-damaging agent resistance protein C [Paenibacillus macerans]